jgi:hypothetical protein
VWRTAALAEFEYSKRVVNIRGTEKSCKNAPVKPRSRQIISLPWSGQETIVVKISQGKHGNASGLGAYNFLQL